MVRILICLISTLLVSTLALADHDHSHINHHSLRFEEATFEANGAPLNVLNARARLKNAGTHGYRGCTVHFYFRLDSHDEWSLIGERPLPGIPPGNAAVCDLVTSTEGLTLCDSHGEVRPCQYRMEVRLGDDELTAKEGEFRPECIFDHDEHDHDHEHGH